MHAGNNVRFNDLVNIYNNQDTGPIGGLVEDVDLVDHVKKHYADCLDASVNSFGIIRRFSVKDREDIEELYRSSEMLGKIESALEGILELQRDKLCVCKVPPEALAYFKMNDEGDEPGPVTNGPVTLEIVVEGIRQEVKSIRERLDDKSVSLLESFHKEWFRKEMQEE